MRISKGCNHHSAEKRRSPLQLQEAVGAEIDKFLKKGHNRRVEKISDKVFIQPVAVTVKKIKTVKIELDGRSLNIAILKQIYQMPNLDNLMEHVAEMIYSENDGEDMLYAYGQTDLYPGTARNCNF